MAVPIIKRSTALRLLAGFCFFSMGCLPYPFPFTMGTQIGGWLKGSSRFALTVPVPLKIEEIHDYGNKGDYSVRFLDLNYGESIYLGWDESYRPESTEVSVGIGYARAHDYPRKISLRVGSYASATYLTASAGLSYISASGWNETTLSADRDRTLGFYINLGMYQSTLGGLLLHAVLAPQVELGGQERAMSSVSISYWIGWGLVAIGAAYGQ